MTSITQEMKYRLSLIQYAEKFGVTKATIKYKTNRQYIYRWMQRYDGTPESLRDRSRRPHHHPNQHTEAKLKLIRDMRRRKPHDGLVVFWVKLRRFGAHGNSEKPTIFQVQLAKQLKTYNRRDYNDFPCGHRDATQQSSHSHPLDWCSPFESAIQYS